MTKASEIMKGCGIMFCHPKPEDFFLCHSCEKTRKTLKEVYEEELEFLQTLYMCCDELDFEDGIICNNCKFIDRRITHLQKEIKILEGKE